MESLSGFGAKENLWEFKIFSHNSQLRESHLHPRMFEIFVLIFETRFNLSFLGDVSFLTLRQLQKKVEVRVPKWVGL